MPNNMRKLLLFIVLLFPLIGIGQTQPVNINNLPHGNYVKDTGYFIYWNTDSNLGQATQIVQGVTLKNYVLTNTPFADTGSVNIQYVVPTNGQTITSNGKSVLVLEPAGTLSTLTVAMPAGSNGQEWTIISTQAITTLTITSGSTILQPITTLGAGGAANWIFYGTKWYR